MVPVLFCISFSRHPFTYPICNVSFTQWFNCFSDKWESKRIVLVISRMLKEKNRFPNSKHLVTFKVTQVVNESVLCIFFITRDLSSLTRDVNSTPAVKGWSLNHWTTRADLTQVVPWGFCTWWADLGNHVYDTAISWWKERPKDLLLLLFSHSVGSDSVKDPESRAVFQGSFRHTHWSVGSKEGVLVSTAQWIRRKALESQGITGPGR